MLSVDTINVWAEKWGGFAATRVIESTIVFLLVGGLWLLLRRRQWVSAQFGYWLFLLVLFKLIVPGHISVPDLVLSLLPNHSTHIADGPGMENMDITLEKPGNGASNSSSAEASKFDPTKSSQQGKWRLGGVFMLIWLCVVVLCTIRLFLVDWRARRMFHRTSPLDPKRIDIDLKRLVKIAGVRQPVRWVTGSWVNSPMAFGLVRPRIAVPNDFSERYTQNQIQWMLLHELAHIKRCDALVSILQNILQILFFFHPVVWLTNSVVDQLREYACDDIALSGSQASRKDCGEGFLSLIMQANGLPTVVPATLGMIDYKTTIRRRLMRILDNKRLLHSRISSGSLAFLFVLALLICPFGIKTTAAQVGQWMMVSNEGPSPRSFTALTWNSKDNVIMLHGGLGQDENGAPLNCTDTWTWDGSKWTLVSDSGPGLWGTSIAYDASRGVLVVVGGAAKDPSAPLLNSSGNNVEQTGIVISRKIWEWDGNEWREALDSKDICKFQACVAYDPVHEKVVICGGLMWDAELNRNVYKNDTWTWDGTNLVKIDYAPTPLSEPDMLQFDPSLNQLVLWGFSIDYKAFYWLGWNGAGWSKITNDNAFPDTINSIVGVCFDTDRSRFVGIGAYNNTILGKLFESSDKEFSFVDTNVPDPRANPAMCYDPARKQAILFGGVMNKKLYGDTWAYTVSSQSRIPGFLWMNY